MSEYQKFVKKHLASLKGQSMSQQEKMSAVAQMWRESGKSKGGKVVSLAGGKVKKSIRKSKKGGSTLQGEEMGGTVLMKGGKLKLKGGNVVLNNGMVLHPSMLGGAWYNDLWNGIKDVAKIAIPIAKMIL